MVDHDARNRILNYISQDTLSHNDLTDMMSIKSKDEAVRVFQTLYIESDNTELVSWKLFLQSGYEYRWGSIKLPWWSLLLIPVIMPVVIVIMLLGFYASEWMQTLFAQFGFHTNIGTCFYIFVMLTVVPGITLLSWFRGRMTHRDRNVYPFYSRDEYEAAVAEGSVNY